MGQLGSQWTDFPEILHLGGGVTKIYQKSSSPVKIGQE
jgi:hypothetical protein